MIHRGARVLVASSVALLIACAGCTRDADDSPEPSASGPTTVTTAAPALAGVPACPPSDPQVPARGDGLPDLTLPCLTQGPDVRLAGLRGTPTVVNVWASWCPPCREELGYLADLQSRARGDLRVLGIDLLDRPEAARAAIEDFGVNFPSVEDADGEVRGALNVQAPPVTFFVEADGRIAFTKVGQIRSQAELDALVRKHLGVSTQ